MIPARIDLQQERWELMQLAVAIWQPVLVLILCLGLVLAFAHLLTMLGTRWGKRRVSLKALLFSIVVHLTLAAGIISLLPEATTASLSRSPYNEPPTKQERDVPEKFKVQQVFEQPLARTTPLDAPRPVWEQITEALPQHVERTPAEFTLPPESPTERPLPEPIAAAPQPEITPLPVSEPVLPTPTAAQPESAPSAPAADMLQATAVAAEARPDLPAPTEARTRSEAVATAFGESEAVERPSPGTVDRVSADVDPNRDITSVAGFQGEMANLQRNDEAAAIERREGPAPSTLNVPEAGIGQIENDDRGQSGAGFRPQMARERTPARQGRETIDEPVERYRPDGVPGPSVPNAPALAANSSYGSVGPGLATEAPTLDRMELATTGSSGAGRVPAPYQLREPERRQQAVEQFGGSLESENAVKLGLKWLADNQHANGHWDAAAHGAGSVSRREGNQDLGFVGRDADTGITGLALLAFLACGNTWEAGDYAENVDLALQWLIAQQAADGSLSGAAGTNDGVYCHAIATCALTEAYALRTSDTSGEFLREPVLRALQFTLQSRTADRGWRYVKEEASGDMSIFGWQVMSLTNAELGGIPIASDVRQDLIRFLTARSAGRQRGLAAYRLNDQPSPAMTAEALFCKQKLGMSRENPASTEAVNYLLRYPPHRTQLNYYYWYYATLALREYGGEPWERWNAALRDLLVQEQRQSGADAGSWDPRDVWGIYGGRVYSTAMATLCLEAYYRFAQDQGAEKQPATGE
jgi:hypothetical protein